MSEKAKKLAEIREAVRQAEERYAAAREADAVEAQVAKEERALADIERKERYAAECGPEGKGFIVVNTLEESVFLKKPNHLHFKRFMEADKQNVEQCYTLVRTCLLYPSEAAFTALLESLPAVLLQCVEAVNYLAGHRKFEVEKK